MSTNKKQPKIPGIVFLFFCFLAFLLNANRLHRAAFGRILSASDIFFLVRRSPAKRGGGGTYSLGLAGLIHLKNIRAKRSAGPAAEAKLLVDFNRHNNKFKILYK